MQDQEALNESVEILSEDTNDLYFKINIEGAATGPAKARLFCEASDISYAFNGFATEGDVVQFTIPKGRLPVGEYVSAVEVFVENKYFLPVAFTLNVKRPVQVTAESVKIQKKVSEPAIRVSARIEKQTLTETTVTAEAEKPKFPTLASKFGRQK